MGFTAQSAVVWKTRRKNYNCDTCHSKVNLSRLKRVHIVKKARKWECKICGAKQSFKRNFGKGTGKDCRNHVMRLNELRFVKTDSTDPTDNEVPEKSTPRVEPVSVERNSVSKWAKFLDEDTGIKQTKRRKIHEGYDEIKNVCEALDTDIADKFINDQSNIKCTKHVGIKEDTTEKEDLKCIFDSSLDNIDDLLSFI